VFFVLLGIHFNLVFSILHMDLGNSNLNASSLIDLKAELHKKYESFRNLKLNRNTAQPSKHTPFKNKGEPIKEKNIKQKTVQPKEVDYEEEASLKKSRLALEAKAKLYEKIVSNSILIDDEQRDSYLVDFERKVLYNSQEPERIVENEASENTTHTVSSSSYQNNFEFRSQTSLKPEASCAQHKVENFTSEKPDQPIHYQNVQHNEVRDHGTGYFAFSMDESERKEQMEELDSLRQETEEQRLKKQRLQRKRKAILQARLAKICERKNIDQSVLESYAESTEENVDDSHQVKIDLTSIPLPERKTESEKKPTKVRPWDVGKDNLQNFISEKKIKSQNQWIEEKREERHTEFAPPSAYTNYYM